MVMKFEPLQKAIHKATHSASTSHVVCLSAQGKLFDHAAAERLSTYSHLVLVAGRYEGIDERLIETEVDEEVSVGDYVVNGGELPAMIMVEALVRQIPGTLGHEESAAQDSFVDGLLDCPHYTRPESMDGLAVPGVLLGGDHQAIGRWRKKQSLGRTYLRRPDLIAKMDLSNEQQSMLEEFLHEQKTN